MKSLQLKATTKEGNPIAFNITPATVMREVSESVSVYDVQIDTVETRPKRKETDCADTVHNKADKK